MKVVPFYHLRLSVTDFRLLTAQLWGSVWGSSFSQLNYQPWICHRNLYQSWHVTGAPCASRKRDEQSATRHPFSFKIKSFLKIYEQRRALSSHLHEQRASKTNETPQSPRKELPSQEEHRRSHIAKGFSHLMDNMQSNIFIAGQRLNDLTGYSGIETLKKDIEDQGKPPPRPAQTTLTHRTLPEQLVQSTRSALQDAKNLYTAAISQRSASQREVNELLQRKHAWSAQDLERFTSLYRSDHTNEQTEATTRERVTVAERECEDATAKLGSSILARYHEEQIWSDKIRRMSTWGTWGLMGVNVLLFLVFQIGVEPWRRKRLVKGFEDKVMEALEREGAATNAATEVALAALQNSQAASHHRWSEELKSPAPTDIAGEIIPPEVYETLPFVSTTTPHNNPFTLQETVNDTLAIYANNIRNLFSDKVVTVRKVDLTIATIEGTMLGIALTSIVATLLRNLRS